MRDNLIDAIIEDPSLSSFFEVTYLLQVFAGARASVGNLDSPADETVRFRNVPSLMFPAHHLNRIERNQSRNGDSFEIETSLLGLYGINSPLPLMYTSTLIDFADDEGIRNRRDFLDLFNHRLLSLLFRTDEYRHTERPIRKTPQLQDKPESELPLVSGVMRLAGVDGSPELESLPKVGLSAGSLGYLCLLPRSAQAIELWIGQHFPHIQVQVIEFTPIWRCLLPSEQNRLGNDNCSISYSGQSGEATGSMILGENIVDTETKFTIELGPLEWCDYLSLLPHEKEFSRLCELLEYFVPDWLDYDIELVLTAEATAKLSLCLNGASSCLGFTTGIFDETNVSSGWRVTIQPKLISDLDANAKFGEEHHA